MTGVGIFSEKNRAKSPSYAEYLEKKMCKEN